jgi:hypothetical protein
MQVKKIVSILVLSFGISQLKAFDPITFILGAGCWAGCYFTGAELWKALEKSLGKEGTMEIDPKINIFGWSPKISVSQSLYEELAENGHIEVGPADALRYIRARFGQTFGWGLATLGLFWAGCIILAKSLQEEKKASSHDV